MIVGIVNTELEAIINLSIRGSDGREAKQNAIVDTGFNDWLSLPPSIITRLNLTWKRRGLAILGDGSDCIFDVYEAMIGWDDAWLTIPIDEADSEPLIGMALMRNYKLKMQIFPGGQVKLQRRSEHIGLSSIDNRQS